MNQSMKLELSKETLRCLDDQDLAGVAGGWKHRNGGENQTGICVSNVGENNSCVCQSVGVCNSGILCIG